MSYTKSSPEWQAIMRESRWFSPETMKYWNCTVLWDTLTPVGNGEWLFLSLDDNYTRTERMYSVRLADTQRGTVDTLSFQETSDFLEATSLMSEHSFELGSRC